MSSAKKWKLPFKIDYEVGVITLVTFVMSAASLGWQIFNYFQGAEVRLVPPDQIVLGSNEGLDIRSRDAGSYAHFIVRMSYVNEGAAGYNAAILREKVRITFEGHPPFEHQWYQFVTHDLSSTDRNKIKVDKESDARPFPLPAGTSESHATLFQPWPKDCSPFAPPCNARDNYVIWQAFVDLLKDKRAFEVQIVADTINKKNAVMAKCKINMSNQALDNLVTAGWASPVCLK